MLGRTWIFTVDMASWVHLASVTGTGLLSPGCGGEFPLYLVSFSQGILSTVALVLKTVLSYACLLLITQVH